MASLPDNDLIAASRPIVDLKLEYLLLKLVYVDVGATLVDLRLVSSTKCCLQIDAGANVVLNAPCVGSQSA